MKLNFKYICIVLVTIVSGSCTMRVPDRDDKNTSVLVSTQGKPISPDSIMAPKVNVALSPEIIPVGAVGTLTVSNTIHPLAQPTIVPVNSSWSHEHTRVISPTVSVVKTETAACVLPEPVPASALRFKDEANYNIQYMDVGQGLPSSYVRELMEDSQHNIWICSAAGFLRYSGKSFVNFSEKNKLLEGYVVQAEEDKHGNMWMATPNGLVKYDGAVITRYTFADSLEDNSVGTVKADSLGNIWFGTLRGLSRFDGKNFTTWPKEAGFDFDRVNFLLFDNQKRLWFATGSAGVYCFDGQSFVPLSEQCGLLSNNMLSIAQDHSGNMWFTGETGACKYTGTKFEYYKAEQGLINSNVRNVMADSKGNIWFSAYRGGMSRFDGKAFTWFTQREGLTVNTVDCFMEDENGNIWVGTDGGGICKYTPNSFTHFTAKEGLNRIIMSAAEDRDGKIWMGTYDDGLCIYDGKSFTSLIDKNKSTAIVWYVMQDRKGTMWFGTANGGLVSYNGKTFSRYTTKEGLNSNYTSCLLEDRDGNIWVGTNTEGACKFDGKQFSIYKTEQGLCSNDVRDIVQDRDGNIWIATSKGLNKLSGKRVTAFTKEHNLLSTNVKNLMLDRKGHLWIGSLNGGGLNRYDGKYMIAFSKKEGLSDDNVRSICEDSPVNSHKDYTGIWVSTDNGIDHLLVKDSLPGDFYISVYKREDGLRGEDFCSNSGVIDSKGRAWWGSVKGLAMLQTNDVVSDNSVPVVKLNNISLEQSYVNFRSLEDSIRQNKGWFIGEKKQINLSNIKFTSVAPFFNYPLDLSLPYNINNITFNYSAISWRSQHKLKYQYFLDGADKEWHPVTSETKAIYTSLGAGDYTFKVKACGASGKWGDVLEYRFTVLPPWWKTWWAYVLYAALFVAAILLYLNRRTLSLRRKQKELEEIIVQRTADVVEEKNKVQEKNQIIEHKQKEILDSIQYAENIQRTLLANHDFVNQTLPDSFVFFQPKDIVSGDFYWATKIVQGSKFEVQSGESVQIGKPDADTLNFKPQTLNSELFYLAVCDSTGHGVPGAFMSLLNISFLNEAISEKHIYEPGKVFDHVRERLISSISRQGRRDGMDGILLCFNMAYKSITYAAANNAPVLVKNNEIYYPETDKMPVGSGEKNESFRTFKLPADKGDMLYIYTDGFADQFGGPKGKKFKYRQLNDLLLSIAALPLPEQKQRLSKAFAQWKGELEQVDDICLIGIRV